MLLKNSSNGSSNLHPFPTSAHLSSEYKFPLNECNADTIAKFFKQNGALIMQNFSKSVFQSGPYVLKQITRNEEEYREDNPNQSYSNIIKEKFLKDCFLLQNEYFVSQHIKKINGKNIVLPLYFEDSQDGCILLSPFMNQRDSWFHLITRNESLFSHIDYSRLQDEEISEQQTLLLTSARFILFGVMKLAVQIATALQFLHNDIEIAHNDIKPDNFFAHYGSHSLLLSNNSTHSIYSEDDDGVNYYLGDFGYAKPIGLSSQQEVAQLFVSKNPTYLAPEVLQFLENKCVNLNLMEVEKQGDIFALGVSLYQILFQTNPFHQEGSRFNDTFSCLLSSDLEKCWSLVNQQLKVYSNMTDIDSLKDLLSKMLEKDPSKRITVQQVLQHEWLADIKSYLYEQ